MKRWNAEDGSLLLVMLMSIAVAGMTVVLFSLVSQSQETTRRDRAWTEAIQVADSGLQQAYSYLSTTLPPAGVTEIHSDAASGDPEYAADFTSTAGGGDFNWVATASGEDWLVRSEGTVNGVTRIVEALFTKGTVQAFALFSEDSVTLKGSNGVKSYKRNAQLPCSIDPTPPCSLKGFVGTNGDLTLNGNAAIDFGFIFGGGDCSGCGGNKSRIPEEFDIDGYALALEAEADIDCPSGGTQAWSASSNGNFTAGTTYCLTTLTWDGDMAVVGNSSDDPATVYVFGNVSTSKNHTNINCYTPPGSGCTVLKKGDTPDISQDPGGLRIRVIGSYTVTLQNQSVYTMAMDAPRSVCPGPGGQLTLYGYIICKELGTQGGYDVAYDEELNSTGTGDYRIVGYREELRNTTSFS